MKAAHAAHVAVRSYDDALAACREARFGYAITVLDELQGEQPDSAARLLHARILLRTSPTDAVATIARFLERLDTQRDKNEGWILLGAAQARVGDFRSAHLAFQRVRDSLDAASLADEALLDELQYRTAATLWMERKLELAEPALRPLLAKPHSKYCIESLILDGAIQAAHGRFERQAATLLQALKKVTAEETRDVLHWAHVTAQLSYLAREMPNPSLRDAVYENIEAVPWTKDIADLHFKALKAVGWRRALEGDYLSAFRLLKRARQVAPTEAWQVMALCDRAHLAQSLGERRFTEQELDEVSELADRIEWRAINGEERIALLLLAVLYAPTDSALALSYIARYQEAGNRFDGLLSANDDRRTKATVSYSLGYVYARLNYKNDALVFLREAWATFQECGYDWRAARCAKEIAGATRDPAWVARAQDKIALYPSSWMAAEIAVVAEDIRTDRAALSEEREQRGEQDTRLTPAQREVYTLLMEGHAVSAIANRLQRSEFTVRNHIKAIFKAYNVNSRAALMSDARRPAARAH